MNTSAWTHSGRTVGRLLGSVRCWPFLSLALVLALPALAEDEKPAPPPPRRGHIQTDLQRRVKERKRGDEAPRTHGSMRQFLDHDGSVTITNRPEKYRERKGFSEVKLSYEAVRVAPKYQKYTTAAQYSSDSIADLVRENAKRYGLDEKLVHAVIRIESDYDPYSVSSAGARGLMQLMPETAADMGVKDIFDPAQNIAGGTQYLAKMLGLFDNNLELALAAYNAGPNAVKEYGGIPPYRETQAYVKAVCAHAGKDAKIPTKAKLSVKSSKPKVEMLPPSKKQCYTIHFRSGYTQHADKIIDEDPYFYIQYGNRTALIRKERVARISEPS